MSTATLERNPVPPTAVAPPRTSTLVIIAFGLVYVVWGSTYLAIRVGIESFPPLLLAGSRHLLTGLILYPILRWKTGVRPTASHWRMSFITGFLLLGVGNGGVCLAERTVPSGVTALLVATVSLWMVIVDWLRPGGTRPGGRVAAGLLLGFSGLALLVGPKNLGGSGRVDPFGVGLLLVASLAWACGSVYSKHSGWIAGILSGEVSALHLSAVSTRSWVALGYLIVFGSMIGFTAYIYILKKSTATRVATYAFVNPVVALFLGWLLIGESINLRTIIAAAVILTAVLLVITAPHPVPLRAKSAATQVAEA